VKQPRIEAEALERGRQMRRLNRWATDVEPGDQPGDGDWGIWHRLGHHFNPGILCNSNHIRVLVQ
jgi:hypothetical protein